MKIIVCVKQVPDTSGKVAVNPDGTLNRASMQTITNPDDMNAVEAALKLKDATGCKVMVVTMGPPPAAGMLRELMAMGADEGVLVSAREFGGSDTYATSQILAADIQKDGNTITVKRMLEDGYMTIKVKTPCLLTCIKELNEPRYMSIDGIYATYNKPLETFDYEKLKDHPLIDATTIGLKGSPTNIFKSFTPPQKGAGKMLEGAGKETCEELASILAAKHII